MKHLATSRFWSCYHGLPEDVQGLADRCYELLRHDPRHPSLQFKKVGNYWSIRVGLHYRALGIEDANDLAWFWIGPHAEYDKLLGYA